MGKASSAKKVARAARAGGSTKQRNKNWAFPAGIAAIVIIGALVVFVARGSNETASAVSPVVGDHWHAAFGVYVCNDFLPAVADGPQDVKGIHTHQDGIIHIHPFAGSASGNNAKLQVFADQVGMKLSSDGFTMPDGTEYKNGYDCNGTPAVVTVSQWNSADELMKDPNTPPDVVYTKDFGSIHFGNDRMAFTIAVVPKGKDIPQPPSAPKLPELGTVDGGDAITVPSAAGSVEGTVAPGTDAPAPTDVSTSTPATSAASTG